MAVRLDRLQRNHAWVGLPIAVFYKFFDDQGGYLAALITYYGFLSFFPLLLLGVTVLGFVLAGNVQLQGEILNSALSQFPIIGDQIRNNLHRYTGSGPGLVIGLVGTLYGGLGVAQAGQYAMNVVWAVPRNSRPNPLKARARSLLILLTFGTGLLATTGLSAAATGANQFASSLQLGGTTRVLAVVAAAAVNVVLFVVAFRVLTTSPVTTRDVAIGATLAGLCWEALQAVGTYWVGHKLRDAQAVYGLFGLVLGLMAWIYIEALVVVLCAELNAVLRRRLWPRALLTPFTDEVSLTEADETAYRSYARTQRFKGFETIEVDFDDEPGDGPPPPSGRDGEGVGR